MASHGLDLEIETDNDLDTDTRPEPERAESQRARCADGNGSLSFLFFSDDDFEIARAQAICRGCGRRTACLERAIATGEHAGVWGGMVITEGVPSVRKPRKGRPPKIAPGMWIVDEVPVPPHLLTSA